MNAAFLGIPGPLWGGICLALAVLFVVVWPSRFRSEGVARIILRWGHAIVWLLLALWIFLRIWTPDLGVANVLPLLAGIAYAAFVLTLVTATRRPG